MEELTAGRVLIIDEDITFVQTLVNYLEDNDFKASAISPQQVREYLQSNPVDIILCEYEFKELNGHDLIASIIQTHPNIPLIVISRSQEMNDVIDALRLGAWNFFQKPLTLYAPLEHAMCRALEKRRLEVENALYKTTLENLNKRLKESLSILEEDQIAGRNVQIQLLPPSHFELQNMTIDFNIIPSLYLSGDFIDYFKLSDSKIGFYVADVSGHGASSAFITVLLKSFIDNLQEAYQHDKNPLILQPASLLKQLSDYLYSLKLGKYLTMNYFIIDTIDQTLEYSIGGHYPSPIIFDGKEAQFLPGGGFAVGIFDKASFKSEKMTLPPQYQLTLFSDGIMEILKGKDLTENEAKLLSVLSDGILAPHQLQSAFNIAATQSYPDDIALFTLVKH